MLVKICAGEQNLRADGAGQDLGGALMEAPMFGQSRGEAEGLVANVARIRFVSRMNSHVDLLIIFR